MGLIDSPLCRRCGTMRKPQLTSCVSVKPWRHSDIPIWVPFSWTLINVRSLSLGSIWKFITGTGLPWLGHQFIRHKGPVKKARDWKGWNPFISLFYSNPCYACTLHLELKWYRILRFLNRALWYIYVMRSNKMQTSYINALI